ncbi:MAG: hypothetical protein H6711_04625 [Myxococcales bacterium]|nr:hypothetical protein [Myxococcales bacterium]
MPKDGGAAVTLTQTIGTSRTLTRDGDDLYWVSSGIGGGVFRAPLAGGLSEALVSPEIAGLWALALDETHLYWSSVVNHTVSFADLQGADPTVWVDGLMAPTVIALSETHIFFTDFEAGAVLRVGKPQ